MKHYRSLEEVTLQNSWMTVGVFDGVHRGHQQIIHRLVEGTRSVGATSAVLTFDPHPSRVFGRGEVKLLTLPDERAEILGEMGVDVVITHPFNTEVADTSAFDFMQRLKTHGGLVHLVLGYDSALGKNREGNVTRLAEIGKELGYALETIQALSDESGVISSTGIRKLVSVGKVEEAAQLMGRPHRVRGPVVRGDQRGRKIGYPTANVDYPGDKLIPPNGIYACWAYLDGEQHKAAVNIGINPTFTPDKKSVNVEAYLLDFDREIYGETLELRFVSRLRDELKFDSVEILVGQIGRDVEQTREMLETK